jgi:hypothetical protein
VGADNRHASAIAKIVEIERGCRSGAAQHEQPALIAEEPDLGRDEVRGPVASMTTSTPRSSVISRTAASAA